MHMYISSSCKVSIIIWSKCVLRYSTEKHVSLPHNSTRPHTSRITHENILELDCSILPIPPFLPDLVPTECYLFRSVKNTFIEKSFSNENQIRELVKHFFALRPAEFYSKGIENFYKWQEVIVNNGE